MAYRRVLFLVLLNGIFIRSQGEHHLVCPFVALVVVVVLVVLVLVVVCVKTERTPVSKNAETVLFLKVCYTSLPLSLKINVLLSFVLLCFWCFALPCFVLLAG